MFVCLLQMLKRNQQRAAGSVIILVSQGTVSSPDLEASLELLREEEVTLAAIEYPSLGKREVLNGIINSWLSFPLSLILHMDQSQFHINLFPMTFVVLHFAKTRPEITTPASSSSIMCIIYYLAIKIFDCDGLLCASLPHIWSLTWQKYCTKSFLLISQWVFILFFVRKWYPPRLDCYLR